MSIRVTVYSKEQCPLCEQAKDLISRLAQDFPIELEEIDIKSSEELLEKYRDAVPVVEIDGKIIFKGKITELWLRRVLEK